MIRAVVGARVSVVKGNEKTSHLTQREAGVRHAEQRDMEVVGFFEDLDVSATVAPFDRPDLGPWLDDSADGMADAWDAMIFAKVDRAFRSIFDCVDVARWAEAHKKILIFTDDNITLDFRSEADSMATMMAKIFLMLAALFAEMELKRIKNRAKDAHAYLRRTPRWPGGQPPFGYMIVDAPDGQGKSLAPDPVTSKIVRRMGALATAGKSQLEIAKILTAEKAVTPARYYAPQNPAKPRRRAISDVWNPSSVGKILNSDACMGIKLTGPSVRERKPLRDRAGLPIVVAEPLFTAEEWAALKLSLAKRAKTMERSAEGTAPLLGIVHCGQCQSRLYRVVNKSAKKVYEYYRCTPKKRLDENGVEIRVEACSDATFRGADLSAYVEQMATHYLGKVSVVRKVYVPGEDHSMELEQVVRAMAGVREEYDEGLYDYPDGEEEYRERIGNLASTRKRLMELPQRKAEWVTEETGETYADAWTNAPDSEVRRQLLLDSGIRVNAWQGRIEAFIPEDLRSRLAQMP